MHEPLLLRKSQANCFGFESSW